MFRASLCRRLLPDHQAAMSQSFLRNETGRIQKDTRGNPKGAYTSF